MTSLSSDYSIFTILGLLLITLGILALLIPFLLESEALRWLERIPPIIIYVYRRDGFTFITSPILIIISVLYLLYRWLQGAT